MKVFLLALSLLIVPAAASAQESSFVEASQHARTEASWKKRLDCSPAPPPFGVAAGRLAPPIGPGPGAGLDGFGCSFRGSRMNF